MTSAATTGPLVAAEIAAPLGRAEVTRRQTAQLVARSDLELLEDLPQVVLHRSRADEQLRADLGVGEAVAGETCDLSLVRCEQAARLVGARAGGLAGCRELATGALRKPLGSEAAERVVGGTKLLARVQASVLATQPFAVQELGSGQVRGEAAAGQPLDRLLVEGFGGRAVGQQRARAGLDPEGPVGAACSCSFAEALEGRGGEVWSIATHGCLDELDQREGVKG